MQEITPKILQPWEKISFNVISSGGIAQYLDMVGGLDFSDVEAKTRNIGKVGIAEDWMDTGQELLQGYYEDLQDEMDTEWWEDALSFLAEWGLNYLFPGLGTLITAGYEYDQSMSAMENYEANVQAMKDQYSGTFLEDWINGAEGMIGDMKDAVNQSTILGLGIDFLMPVVGKQAEGFVPDHWKDWWEGAKNDVSDLFNLEQVNYDLNEDDVIDISDIVIAAEKGDEDLVGSIISDNFEDPYRLFNDPTYNVEEYQPEYKIDASVEEIKESLLNGEGKYTVNQLYQAAEQSNVPINEVLTPKEINDLGDKVINDPDFIGGEELSVTLDNSFLKSQGYKSSPSLEIIEATDPVSGTPAWDALSEDAQKGYIETLDLPKAVNENDAIELARKQWQLETDFLKEYGTTAVDLQHYADKYPGKGMPVYPQELSNIYEYDSPEFQAALSDDGYTYNILGKDYSFGRPLEFWDENFAQFAENWDETFAQIDETPYVAPELNFSLNVDPTGGGFKMVPGTQTVNTGFFTPKESVPGTGLWFDPTTRAQVTPQSRDIVTSSINPNWNLPSDIYSDISKFDSEKLGLDPLVEGYFEGFKPPEGGRFWEAPIFQVSDDSLFEKFTGQSPKDMYLDRALLGNFSPLLGIDKFKEGFQGLKDTFTGSLTESMPNVASFLDTASDIALPYYLKTSPGTILESLYQDPVIGTAAKTLGLPSLDKNTFAGRALYGKDFLPEWDDLGQYGYKFTPPKINPSLYSQAYGQPYRSPVNTYGRRNNLTYGRG